MRADWMCEAPENCATGRWYEVSNIGRCLLLEVVMSRNQLILALLWIVAALSGCSSPTPRGAAIGSTEPQVRAAISRAWRDHIDAAKRKDLKGVVAMYAEEVVYIVPKASEVRGRPAIETMEAQGLAAADVLDAAHTIHDLQVFDNVAYEIGTVAGPIRAQGQPAQILTFHFMGMWQRQGDGTWRLWYLVGLPKEQA